MTLEGVSERFATNESRQILLASLTQVIELCAKYFTHYRLVLFGSFIAEKELPGDLDILLWGRLAQPGSRPEAMAALKAVYAVQIKSRISMSDEVEPPTYEALVEEFNKCEKNLQNAVRIDEYVALTTPS